MSVDLEAVLASKKVQTKTTGVAKDVELHYDLGNMLATDLNALDTQALRCACVRACVCVLAFHLYKQCVLVLRY